MSITVRLYSPAELKAIKAGTADKKLITTFLNNTTFLEEEIRAYPYDLRHAYIADIDGQEEYVHFYACDDESALWFIRQEYYPESVVSVQEQITTYRDVPLEA